jgi:hypothetical protein
MAPTVNAYRVGERDVLVSIGGAQPELMGWDFNAVARYMRDVVLPLELRCDGAAKKLIGAFRDKLAAAAPLLGSTTITVTPAASEDRYYIDNAKKFAVKLGIATDTSKVPETFKVTFGDVQAAEEEYLLSTLQATQSSWELALGDDAPDTLISIPAQQSYSEQPALF